MNQPPIVTDVELATRRAYAQLVLNEEVYPKPKMLAQWFLTATSELLQHRADNSALNEALKGLEESAFK